MSGVQPQLLKSAIDVKLFSLDWLIGVKFMHNTLGECEIKSIEDRFIYAECPGKNIKMNFDSLFSFSQEFFLDTEKQNLINDSKTLIQKHLADSTARLADTSSEKPILNKLYAAAAKMGIPKQYLLALGSVEKMERFLDCVRGFWINKTDYFDYPEHDVEMLEKYNMLRLSAEIRRRRFYQSGRAIDMIKASANYRNSGQPLEAVAITEDIEKQWQFSASDKSRAYTTRAGALLDCGRPNEAMQAINAAKRLGGRSEYIDNVEMRLYGGRV